MGSNEAALPEIEYEEVEEGAHVTSRYSSFMNKRPSKPWGIEETRIFYNVRYPISLASIKNIYLMKYSASQKIVGTSTMRHRIFYDANIFSESNQKRIKG